MRRIEKFIFCIMKALRLNDPKAFFSFKAPLLEGVARRTGGSLPFFAFPA